MNLELVKLFLTCLFSFDFRYIKYLKQCKKQIFLIFADMSFADVFLFFMLRNNIVFNKCKKISEVSQLKHLYCNRYKKLIIDCDMTQCDFTCEYSFNLDTVVISNNNEIPEDFFANDLSLRYVYIHKQLEIINSCAFENCINLAHIHLPKSLKEILNSAFKNCSSLKVLHIPSTIELIDTSAFENCTSLEKVIFY